MTQAGIPRILSPERLHIIVGCSARGSLTFLLNSAYDVDAPNVTSADNLLADIGPLELLFNPIERQSWFAAQDGDFMKFINFEEDQTLDQCLGLTEFYDTVSNWRGEITAWISSLNAADQSLLHYFSQHHPKMSEMDIVDVATLQSPVMPFLSVGECSSDNLAEASQSPFRLFAAEISTMQKTYSNLVNTSKAIRFLDQGHLIGASANAHDPIITGAMSSEWKDLPHVVADIWVDAADYTKRVVDYMFLLWRLNVLQEAGIIERQGESTKPLFEENPLLGQVRLSSIQV